MDAEANITVRISDRITDLKGEGEELLLDRITGAILARFVDGNFARSISSHSLNRLGDRLKDEATLAASDAA